VSRLHARRTELVATRHEAGWKLTSPQPGAFHPTILKGPLSPRDVVGTLSVLGQPIELVVPAGVTGWIEGELGPRTVDYGDPIAVLAPAAAGTAEAAAAIETEQRDARGPVFRAPTSGRYYGRPGPDKPAFVTVGAELATGATICLLEVMKTFNRITYDGDRARVKELLVAEGADVNAGDPLIALEPI
jgi:acetyl-CoA carboxylase biotin carboxyl carrier protein